MLKTNSLQMESKQPRSHQSLGFALASLSEFEIKHRLGKPICKANVKQALELLKTNVINQRLIECVDYLISNIENNEKCVNDSNFKKLSQDYIKWS